MLRLAAACLALLFSVAVGAADADPQVTASLHALFDRQWEADAKRHPESATRRGDLRYNDRLTDESAAAQAAWDAQLRERLAQARGIPRDRLDATDRVSLDLFIFNLQSEVEEQAFAGYRSLLLGALGGTQSHFANLLRQVPMHNREQATQLLSRMAAYPKLMDDSIDQMRRGMALGWVSSKDVLERVLDQIDKQVAPDVEAGPFYAPFKRLGADIPADERMRLQTLARAAIERDVIPSLRRLRAFVADEYMRRAPANGSLHGYPDGAHVYEMLVREGTTTRLSAAQIHAIGLRELAAIRAEMETVMRQTKFSGTFAQFVDYLNTDGRFFHPGPEALLAGYRDIAKRLDAELPQLFVQLPRMSYGVRAIPSFLGDSAEYYNEPALDGTRAGYFNANVEA
jgi:uncharacterized protein (DUF885 family)